MLVIIWRFLLSMCGRWLKCLFRSIIWDMVLVVGVVLFMVMFRLVVFRVRVLFMLLLVMVIMCLCDCSVCIIVFFWFGLMWLNMLCFVIMLVSFLGLFGRVCLL